MFLGKNWDIEADTQLVLHPGATHSRMYFDVHSAEGISFPRLPTKYQCYKRISQSYARIQMARSSSWSSFALMLVARETIFLPARVPINPENTRADVT